MRLTLYLPLLASALTLAQLPLPSCEGWAREMCEGLPLSTRKGCLHSLTTDPNHIAMIKQCKVDRAAKAHGGVGARAVVAGPWGAPALEMCNVLPPARKEACLSSIPDERGDVAAKDGEENDVSMPSLSDPDGAVSRPRLARRSRSSRVAITADPDGTLDLAIPVALSANPPPLPAAAPLPTTLLTLPSPAGPVPTPTRVGPGPIEIDDTISLAAAAATTTTTTYPDSRVMRTAVVNGTEIRVEKTESRVHDIHVEETERGESEPEQDRVIVHVKVFVEHLREAAQRVRRAVLG